MKKYNRQQLNWLIEDCYEDMEQRYDLIDYIIDLQENSIPKKKIEDILKKLDSKKVEERVIKFYTPDKKHYYETDKYNDIIKQVLQELLEGK